MRIPRYRMYNGKLPLWPIFLAGTLAGILIMNVGKSILLEDTGLLNEYTLYHMKYMTVDSSALFYYVLQLRMKSFAALVILATTYLGLFVCMGASFWYGFSVGAFLSALMIRYGLKGLLFAFFGIFPQFLLYVPAMAALLLWCERLYKSIYLKSGYHTEAAGGISIPRNLLRLAVILGIFLLGCLAESFINPGIMSWLLKIF